MSISSRLSRSLGAAVLVAFLSAGAARASTVFVSYGTVTEYGTTFVTASQPGVIAQADAVTGSLSASAFRDGSVAPEARTDAAIYPIGITNSGATPLTLGPVSLDLGASFAHTGLDDGAVIHTVEASLSYGLNDLTLPRIILFYQYTESWSGGVPSFSEFPPTVTSDHGGSVEIGTLNHDALAANLSLPEITLDPGETIYLYADLNVRAQVYGDGHTATTDASSPARLHLALPPGALYTTDAGVPVSWIVPESPNAALLAIVLAFGVALRARG